MLYYLFEYLEKNNWPGAGVFQYISFRSALAIIISLLISVVFGGRIISSLKKLQVGETVRELGLDGQKEKEGTPTMGGFIIILAILIPCLLLTDLTNIYVIVMLVTVVWMAAIGFADDYIKVFKKNKDGLHGRFKIYGQVGLGLLIGLVMTFSQDVVVRLPYDQAVSNNYEIVKSFEIEVPQINNPAEIKKMAYAKTHLTNVPFIKENNFEYKQLIGFIGDNSVTYAWIIFVFMSIVIVTAVSNAANLTDGIDGLAAGVSAIVGAALGILAYVSSNTIIADYLNILYLPQTEELVIFAACFVGGTVGFLWYNSFPAKVFMGDTGSLMIGGFIGAFALLIRKEFLIPILCGVFLVENLSVMLQVGYFKYTKKKLGEGRRIFKMAPIHHHFQKAGMHESKIVTRFWIVQIMLALLTIITLKVR